MEQQQLDRLPVSELQRLLREQGLKVSGTKNAMVRRLEENWDLLHGTDNQPLQRPHSEKTKPKYCCVPLCRNYTNKVLEDGHVVTLHRLPASSSRKKIWIQELKTVRKDEFLTDDTRVCCEHFVGRDPLGIPTLFPSKPVKPTKARRQLLKVCSDSGPSDAPCCESPKDKIGSQTEEPDVSKARHMTEELEIQTAEITTQTEHQSSDVGLQTGSSWPRMVDSATQTALPDIAIEDLQGDDQKTRFYTGFISFPMMMHFLAVLVKHGADSMRYWAGAKRSVSGSSGRQYHKQGVGKPGPKRTLRLRSEFLMVMMRLRLGLTEQHLADIFKVSSSTVSRIMTTWVNFLYDHCKALIPWATQQQIMWNLPKHFQDFPNTQIILDCTEFFIEKSSSLLAQNLTWSEYKHHNTMKVLIGVTPSGMVNFVSEVYGGRVSDRHITDKSGVLARVEAGMTVMADKGFTIEDLLPPGVSLNIPPRIPSKRQMTAREFFNFSHCSSTYSCRDENGANQELSDSQSNHSNIRNTFGKAVYFHLCSTDQFVASTFEVKPRDWVRNVEVLHCTS